MNKTKIQWCDFTVNPIRAQLKADPSRVGHHCVKISPGCAHCYASKLQGGFFGLPGFDKQDGLVEPFLDEKALQRVLRSRRTGRVFWGDMTDLFGEWVPDDWLYRCVAAMALTGHLTHLVLTKRSGRMREFMIALARSIEPLESAAREMGYTFRFQGHPLLPWPIRNVHLGVSVENQPYADERIPDLLATPAAKRFVSYEPALGPVDFTNLCEGTVNALDGIDFEIISGPQIAKLDQIIIGGESGPGARPFDVQWARDTIRQCREAGVACFVKQLGARPVYLCQQCNAQDPGFCRMYEGGLRRAGIGHDIDGLLALHLKDRKGGDMSEWPEDLRVREYA